MSGPRGATHHLRKLILHQRDRPVRIIHGGCVRSEKEIAALVSEQSRVSGKRAWISRQILFWTELGWIDKQARDDRPFGPGTFSRSPDQRQMPFMQSAHGR